MSTVTSPREQFAHTASTLVDADENLALVWAEISGQFFGSVAAKHPERVINVGIREQLLVSAGAGMALAGLRPIVHTFGHSWSSGRSNRSNSISCTREWAACWWAAADRST